MLEDTGHLTGKWDYQSLPSNVVVGQDCYLERSDAFARYRSTREPGLKLGDRVRVYTWTGFSIEPGGYVEVGDDSTLVGARFMCEEQIVVGRRVLISYNVMIADSDFHPLDPELRRQDARANAPSGAVEQRPPLLSKPVLVEDDVMIGVSAIILKGVRIRRGAKVLAGSVVTSDVEQGTVVAGNPARLVDG